MGIGDAIDEPAALRAGGHGAAPASQFLWYIPNQIDGGHRGDTPSPDLATFDLLTAHARAVEDGGWQGALIGTSWGRFDAWTLASALTAATRRFEPLVAIRPGYWQAAQFAAAAATLDHLSSGRLRVNIVSGRDELGAYGDSEDASARRYDRTREFMVLVRRLWSGETVNFAGTFYQVAEARLAPSVARRPGRAHPPLYFGGASPAAEAVAAGHADVQLFWGEPLDGIAERIARLRALSQTLDRDLPPLEFGLRITTVVRETSEAAWAAAHAKLAAMTQGWSEASWVHQSAAAVGQARLNALHASGDVLDDNLFTAPARLGAGGAASTWLVGSAAEVAAALARYRALGISHFVLSDTPYREEADRQGRLLLPLLREAALSAGQTPARATRP